MTAREQTQQQYDEFAASDAPDWAINRANSTSDATGAARAARDRYAVALRQLRSDETILDYGCGTAEMLQHLPASFNGRYCGVDTSQGMIGRARRQAAKFPHLSTTFLVGGLEALGDTKFDRVVIIGVLPHIPKEEHSDFIQSAVKHLKPRGRITFDFYNIHWMFKRTINFTDGSVDELTSQLRRQGLKVQSIHVQESLRRLLRYRPGELAESLYNRCGLSCITPLTSKIGHRVIISASKR